MEKFPEKHPLHLKQPEKIIEEKEISEIKESSQRAKIGEVFEGDLDKLFIK